MAELQKLQTLSAPHCLLLAVQYAAESDIPHLRTLTAVRKPDFDVETTLRLLLTHLPESTAPSTYIEYLDELVNGHRTPSPDATGTLNLAAVEKLSDTQARRRQRKLELLPLAHDLYRAEPDVDALTHFLVHRAHRIDAETGLLELVPQLLVPFLGHSEYLRTWFISTVLPLLRLGYEYYPQAAAPSLEEFARLKGRRAVDVQLSHLGHAGKEHAARDLRGVVGPWICGSNERKRRKLSPEDRRASLADTPQQDQDDWEALFNWLVRTSTADLPLVTAAITEWDGPEDLDLGGFDEGRDYIDDETQRKLELRYAQTAMVCLYHTESTSIESLETAHALLTRLADLLGLEQPSGFGFGAHALPKYDPEASKLADVSPSSLQSQQLSQPDNTLTQPHRTTVHLLELFLFSAFVLAGLQHPLSIRETARVYLRRDAAEQISLVQKIVHALGTSGSKGDEQWLAIRAKLLWLWNWGSDLTQGDRHTQGLFGHVPRATLETEILKGLLEGSHFRLAAHIYIESGNQPLPLSSVERIVLETAMHHYDNASNGNRTRGGMKRAFDLVSAFKPHFPNSRPFERMQALLSATHAMSFYSLKLTHGVPFQPVNIRVTSDPLSFISKLLSQNLNSYTHLDDLISIGQNLVTAMPSTLMDAFDESAPPDPTELERARAAAERRVIGMTVEAALQEDDFETAYSYVVNRLTPPTPSASPAVSASSKRFSFGSHDSVDEEDDAEDVAWRAALQAGRHRSSPTSSMWGQTSSVARPDLRRLEQRMELLSQALLLAPPRHLEEVLAVWQECEAELTSLLAQEEKAEEQFNDAADRRLPGAFANDTIALQPRREVGRGATEEAPMGLFDVARGAAAAFSKTAFPLRGGQGSRGENTDTSSDRQRASLDLSDSGSIGGTDDRVRRRDMVANAVTGGLASGIGWVLGEYKPSMNVGNVLTELQVHPPLTGIKEIVAKPGHGTLPVAVCVGHDTDIGHSFCWVKCPKYPRNGPYAPTTHGSTIYPL
jgi:hypothetical protein